MLCGSTLSRLLVHVEVESSTLSSVSSLVSLADDAAALQSQLRSNPEVDSSLDASSAEKLRSIMEREIVRLSDQTVALKV